MCTTITHAQKTSVANKSKLRRKKSDHTLNYRSTICDVKIFNTSIFPEADTCLLKQIYAVTDGICQKPKDTLSYSTW